MGIRKQMRLASLIGMSAVVYAIWTPSINGEIGDADRVLYQTLYADVVLEVRTSQADEDNHDLIKKLFIDADAIPDSPGVQQLIYREIVQLAIEVQDFESVDQSLLLLSHIDSEDPLLAPDWLLSELELLYRRARATNRREVGTYYLEKLLIDANRSLDSKDLESAERALRQGRLVARAIESDEFEAINHMLETIRVRERLNARINRLRNLIESHPGNHSAAHELTMLLMLEDQNPLAAADIVELANDQELSAIVQTAVRPLDALEAAEAIRLAEWYASQAKMEDYGTPLYLLSRSLQYYDYVLESYEKRDAMRLQIAQDRSDVEAAIKEIVAENEDATQNDWLDLLRNIHPIQHSIAARIAVEEGVLLADNRDFLVPANLPEGYVLRLQFSYHGGKSGLMLTLPVGNRWFTIGYSSGGHRYIMIAGLPHDLIVRDEELMLSQGSEVDLIVRVSPSSNGTVSIDIQADGKPVITWTGDSELLGIDERYPIPGDSRRVFRISCGGSFAFQSITAQLLE